MVAARRQRGWLIMLALITLATFATPATPANAERALILATTTSVDNSGLLDHLRPQLAAQTGLDVHVVVRGSGAALRLGVSGDADVVFVHDRAAEDAFMAAGHGALRRDIMTSDFLIVGPRGDPAGIAGLSAAAPALRRIAETETLFVSRGDASGTHNAELALWRAAGLDPRARAGSWYRETGSGMGATLNIASALDAHLLTESGTWARFANRGDLTVLVANALPNPYGVILVNPARHPHIPEADARKFIDWLAGPNAQKAIDDFTINGQRPFRSAAVERGSGK